MALVHYPTYNTLPSGFANYGYHNEVDAKDACLALNARAERLGMHQRYKVATCQEELIPRRKIRS